MDLLKESFKKVKEDINSLYVEMSYLKQELRELRNQISSLTSSFSTHLNQKQAPTQQAQNTTTPTHIPTHDSPFYSPKTQNLDISTGNEGVPTDRQTDRQTDTQHINNPKTPLQTPKNPLDNAISILDSLDNIKKEIRLKFKKLTEQEMLVFSTLYQLEEESGPLDYRVLSSRLKLTESSIRDYIGRLLKKGVPIEKKRINNKTILLSISPNLKKIASLPTILKLREI